MSTQPITDLNTRWRLIEDLFHRASDLPRGERAAFLEQACAADPTLLPEILELLQSDSDVAGKVDAQKIPVTPSADDPELLTFRTSTDSWLNRTLGHYTVQHQLGRGGMGVVYLGRRSTPGPHPQAAIKVVRRNLQDSPALNHFLLERDALARLEHPNIARLLDGGVTPEGIPWLALEYVEGQRLDEYVAQPGITVEAIVGLILQLCAAVGYVHRNLILHRDLKPGNVMVTSDGVVKLLDFGTLKILQNDEASAMTQAGMRPVTLRFASPEHVHGQRVSTASDVYSLGIILYRLLAGRFPEPSAEAADTASSSKPQKPFQSPMAGFFEDLREDRLQSPSAFTSLPMPAELARDLDAITMKAIRHAPADRYQTAEALAAELTRALENQPVEARGNNRAYLARKFYTRHAVALWTAAAAFLILCAALGTMAHETRVARQQQASAEVGVDQERNLARLLLFDITPRVELISTTPGQKEIVAKVSAYLDRLNTGPNPDPELQLYQVQGYTALSNILGNPYAPNLGDTRGAILKAQKAVSLAEPLLQKRPDDPRVLEVEIAAYLLLGNISVGNSDLPNAAIYLTRAEALERPILAQPHLTAKEISTLANVEDLLGDLNWGNGRASLGNIVAAEQHVRRAVELYTRALMLEPGSLRYLLGIEACDYKLGSMNQNHHPTVAIGYFQHGLDQVDRMKPEDRELPRSRRFRRMITISLGAAESDVGLVDPGIARLSRVRAEAQAGVQKDPLDTTASMDLIILDINLGGVMARINRPRDGIAIFQEADTLADQLLARNPSNAILFLKAIALNYLGIDAWDAGQRALALRSRAEGMPILLRLAEKPDASPPICLFAAHMLDLLGGDPQLALALAHRAMLGTAGAEELIELATAEERSGDTAAAQKDARKAAILLVDNNGGYSQFNKEVIARILHQPPPLPDASDHGPIYTGKAAFPDLTPPSPVSRLPAKPGVAARSK